VFADRLLGGVTQVVVIQYYFCVRLALSAARPHTTTTHTHTHTHTRSVTAATRASCARQIYIAAPR